ncbi:uncharacterized protein LOC144062801 [Vanacampus margaritifer]
MLIKLASINEVPPSTVGDTSPLSPGRRRTRKFTLEGEKDVIYWQKRLKNNVAAKRSRDKRRLHDLMLERHLVALMEENTQLRAQLLAIQDRYDPLYTAKHQGYYSNPGLVFPMHTFNSMSGFFFTPVGAYPNHFLAPPAGPLFNPPPVDEAVQRAEQQSPTCTAYLPDSQVERRASPHGDSMENLKSIQSSFRDPRETSSWGPQPL